MAISVQSDALVQSDVSYDEFYREHAEVFSTFLRRTLGREREGAGGRIGVADTLQDAMLRISGQWPELQLVQGDERERRLYRCLRDAAGEALRREHGRVEGHGRPRVVAFDFGLLHTHDGETGGGEQELTSAVLGSMARDLAAVTDASQRREVLDRAVLVAGLRALSEREVVALIAVDHLGWDQDELATHLDMDFGALRTALFEARRVFYGVVRHAAGIELDEEERARLHAYQAGELVGRERRVARRHLQHCDSCQALVRELRRFGEAGQLVLAPLPFLIGARALLRSSSGKVAGGTGAGGPGLLGQVGAVKALGLTVGLLGVGVSASSVLAEKTEHQHHPAVTRGVLTRSITPPTGSAPQAAAPTASHLMTHRPKQPKSASHSKTHSLGASGSGASASNQPVNLSATPLTSGPSQTPATAASSKAGGGEFLGQ